MAPSAPGGADDDFGRFLSSGGVDPAAAGTAAVYDGPPTASAASSWRCDSSDYKNERTTSIWEASTYTGEKEQIPNTIASYQVTTKFVNLKAKAVKRNSDDSESISIIFAPRSYTVSISVVHSVMRPVFSVPLAGVSI